ncbi:DUF418 domain-containing protein [Methylobacterium terricola]|uniref:DUF418 domain-containing protein n=1 Tax=Methylobacterium terricola TaxID=2583531 RepID=A0A5C4LJW0_9HYPH|nr:DUF418 domain-containing protein [Methylobacterium terricola]TNC14052.1 DUF418 domain-containing protein [Methylobacterium terricola]
MLAADRASAPGSPAAPVEPTARLGILDALRGLALLGVLAINLEFEFRVSIFRQFVSGPPERAIDRGIDAILSTFVDMKAFALFSLLFGVGLAIQFERMAPARRAMLLMRRLLVLLGFGLIHLVLIWNGDILTEYALAGLIVLPFLFGPTWLPALGSAVFLGLSLVQPLLPPLVAFPSRAWLLHQVAAADRVYATGSFPEILRFRIEEIAGFLPLHAFVLPRTLGLFLLGVVAWRSGLVWRAGHHAWALGWAACLAMGTGTALTLATATRHYSGWPSLGRAEIVAAPLGTIVLALGYALAILAVGTTRAGRRGLAWAEPVGRMAFTNYIVQSLVLGFIFYGYGLGLFGRLDLATGLALVLAVYGAQAVASRWWLAHHRFGPLEGLWRALTYGRRPEPGA